MELVSTVALPILAVLRVLEDAATGLLEPEEPAEEPLDEPPDEPHAASTATAAAAAGNASISRGRLSASSRVSDLIIAISFAMDRPGPLRRRDTDDSAV
jgi:hypothetical protein